MKEILEDKIGNRAAENTLWPTQTLVSHQSTIWCHNPDTAT